MCLSVFQLRDPLQTHECGANIPVAKLRRAEAKHVLEPLRSLASLSQKLQPKPYRLATATTIWFHCTEKIEPPIYLGVWPSKGPLMRGCGLALLGWKQATHRTHWTRDGFRRVRGATRQRGFEPSTSCMRTHTMQYMHEEHPAANPHLALQCGVL